MLRAALGAFGLLVILAPLSVAQVVIEDGTVRSRTHGFRLDGARLEIGAVNPLDAGPGPLAGVTFGLGTRFWPWLDFTSGVRYWTADLDEPVSASAGSGKVTDLSLHTDLHYHLFRANGMRPYVVTGLAGHFVSADIGADPGLEDALSGFNVGVDTGVGVATTRDGLGFRGEIRRQWVEDVGNWSFSLGVGWWPKVRAHRIAQAASSNVATTFAVAAPQTWGNPAPVQTAPAPSRDPELLAALEQLRTDNALMRAKVDSLQRAMGKQVVPPPPPETTLVESVAPDPKVVARDELRAALTRMAQLGGREHALRESDEGFRFGLESSLLFRTGSSELQVGAREELRRLGVVLLRFADVEVVVEGHSDASGPAARNEQLSLERAEAVRSEFSSMGVDAGRIRAVGFGSSKPIADNSTAEGRAQNRRVEVRLLTPDTQVLR